MVSSCSLALLRKRDSGPNLLVSQLGVAVRLIVAACIILAACAGPVTGIPEPDAAALAREQQLQAQIALMDQEARKWTLETTASLSSLGQKIALASPDLCSSKCGRVQLVVGQESDLNAFADGKSVVIMSGMIGFAQNWDAVALVVGHEMSHNILRHLSKRDRNQLAGALLGGILGGLAGVDLVGMGSDAGVMAYSQGFELEADVLGAYLAARAGYDVSQAANLWRRIAAQNPRAIHAENGSHPNTARRFLVLEEVAADIARKRAAGLPLVP